MTALYQLQPGGLSHTVAAICLLQPPPTALVRHYGTLCQTVSMTLSALLTVSNIV